MSLLRHGLAAVLLAAAATQVAAAPTPAGVQIDELTWTELRDAIKAGKTTVIVPVGGTEQSGPHIALGKHNVRVRALAARIAASLGNALVAPVIAYVPEGAIDPPAGHMRFAGTISIPESAFEATLEGAARSFRQAGFRDDSRLQSGRFAQLYQNLTIRIRYRVPGGVLSGIFVDDRRDPKERVTIIADHGTVLKNESGSYLILEDGNLERFEAGKRDPALVAFGRYAFDMSKFSNHGRDVALGIRERYIWELLSPPADDPIFQQLSGQFRAELHDRFMAPVYPFAFAVLTFAFLGTPRTTRQSRNFSIGGSIFAVFGLRMVGFACSVMTVKTPGAALVQYSMLFGSIAIGLWMILGGIVVEPPAALMEAINRSNARIARLFGRPATA